MKGCSLFSGCGGDTLGMKQAGIDVEYFSEINKTFQETHVKNFPESKLIGGDVINIPDDDFSKLNGKIDVLFAGFPCQSFSHGGKKNPNDPRGQLYLQFVRATRLMEPKYIIGENVKGLLTRKTNTGEKFIDVIFKAFADIGYVCHHNLFTANEYGVPQKRQRLIIVGKKGGWTPQWPIPNSQPPKFLNEVLEFSMENTIEVPKELFDEAGVPDEHVLVGEGEPFGKPHPFLIDRANVRGVEYGGKTYGTYAFSWGKRSSPVHCEIVDPQAFSKTIICTYDHQPRLFVAQRVGDKRYLRCFTTNELKQIQGFPKDYELDGSSKEQIVQLGNAVPPPIVREVCKALLRSS